MGSRNLRNKALEKLRIDRRCKCRSTEGKEWIIMEMGAIIIIKMVEIWYLTPQTISTETNSQSILILLRLRIQMMLISSRLVDIPITVMSGPPVSSTCQRETQTYYISFNGATKCNSSCISNKFLKAQALGLINRTELFQERIKINQLDQDKDKDQ